MNQTEEQKKKIELENPLIIIIGKSTFKIAFFFCQIILAFLELYFLTSLKLIKKTYLRIFFLVKRIDREKINGILIIWIFLINRQNEVCHL